VATVQPMTRASAKGIPTSPITMTNSAPSPSASWARVWSVRLATVDPFFLILADAGDVGCLFGHINVHGGDTDDRKQLGGLL